ncbi:MAG: Protein-O-mannosyltransferase, partial [uncultured Nocardioidaceae bacterium]
DRRPCDRARSAAYPGPLDHGRRQSAAHRPATTGRTRAAGGPRHRVAGHRSGHPAGRFPPPLEPRDAAPVRVRRDVLRQGRLVALAARLCPELGRGRRQGDPERAVVPRPADRRPDHGRPPRCRQVADRARRAAARLRASRLAHRERRRRHADGAGHGAAGAPAHRLDAARRGGRAPALPRRPALRALPAGPPGHLRRVLPPQRGVVPGRRPGLDPGPPGRFGGPDQAAPVAAVAARRGAVVRVGDLVQVDRAGPARRLRAPRRAVGHRRPALPRGAACLPALRAGRWRPGVPLPGRRRLRRLPHVVGRLAGQRRRLRGRAGAEQLRDLLGRLHQEGSRRLLPLLVPGAPQPVALPPRRLGVPHDGAGRRHALLPVGAAELAGDAPPGGRGHRARHPSRGPGVRGAVGQHLHPGGDPARHADPVVGRGAGPLPRRVRLARPTGLEVRRGAGRPADDLGAVLPGGRPADLLVLRDRHAAVHDHRDLPAAGPVARSGERLDQATDGRHDHRRDVRGPRRAALRLAVAGVHLRPVEHPGVARPHLVPVLDL